MFVCLAALSGCGLIGAHERAERHAMNGLALGLTDMFVVVDGVWMCPTRQAVLARTACEGGKQVGKNRVIKVFGEAPKEGVWPAVLDGGDGEHKLFVAAHAIDWRPETSSLDDYDAELIARFPETTRIPLESVSVAHLFEEPTAYRGRFLVLRQPSRSMTNKEFAAGTFSFTLEVPVTAGSHHLGPILFELSNQALVDGFESGGRSYQCGPRYCDDFVFVAQLTGRTVERVDAIGNMRRVPVFVVRELGDRYGTYVHAP